MKATLVFRLFAVILYSCIGTDIPGRESGQ